MLDGAARLTSLFAEAQRLEMSAVGMTDHGNVYGAYDFYQQAKASGIKPIIGIEAYVAPATRHEKKPVFWGQPGQRRDDVAGAGSYTHMTLLAENQLGLRNLFRLSSQASLDGFYYKPRMDKDLLSASPDGIIATTGCPSGEVQTRLRLDQYHEALQAASDYKDIFGAQNYFLELMDHGLDIERRVRDGLLRIAKELGLRPLATNDSHYVHQGDATSHDALLCVQSGKTLADPNRLKFDGDGFYVRSAREMRDLWDGNVPGACDTTLLIAERVGSYDDIFAYRDRMPMFPVPAGETQESWFRKEVWAGMARRYGDSIDDERRRRVEYEMDVICQMGFPAYFLVVADLVQWAKDQNIRVGPGRGSATGCLAAYALGIIELDPLEHKLLFERFLNPERLSMPDIDLDFDERRRGDVIRYVTQRWGDDRVAQIVTYGKIKAKQAIKDAARVLGYPFSMGDRVTKAMPPPVMGKEIPLSAIVEREHPRHGEAGEIRKLMETEPDVAKVFETARGLEGLIRQAGVHAAGVILSSEPLLDVVPVWRREADGAVITQWDFPSCESIGLLKMDFLGLRNLTVISDAIVNVTLNRGEVLDLDNLPLDDPKTYELLSSGDTLGVFQLDGGPMRSLLKAMAPTCFEDIAAVLALYRPGPMAANAHIDYADRKNGRKPVVPIHPELAEPLADILGETYGLIVYQEQVMAIAQRVASYSLAAADLLRRAMGKKKKEILDKEFVSFHRGMRANDYSDAAIQTLWDILLPFAGYAFNKSHTAGYGVVSYWTAYLKANYKSEYMAALLTSVGDDKDKMAVYLAECRKMKIQVLPPDVNESEHNFTPTGVDVRFGLGAIRNVGANVVRSIVETRAARGKYTDFMDFLHKSEITVCNKRTVESLIKAGAFESLGHTRLGLVAIHEVAIDAFIGPKREEAKGQLDLFGGGESEQEDAPGLAFGIAITDSEWPRADLLAHERQMLGLYVSSHPLTGAEHVLRRSAENTILSLAADDVADGSTVSVAGIVSGLQRKTTKTGNLYALVQLEDLDASVEVMFFSAAYEAFGSYLAEDAVIAVKGRCDRREGSPRIFATDLVVLDVSKVGTESPVTVTLRTSNVQPELVAELKRTLQAHPGTRPVRLKLDSARGSLLIAVDDSIRVDPTGALIGELKGILGAGCLE